MPKAPGPDGESKKIHRSVQPGNPGLRYKPIIDIEDDIICTRLGLAYLHEGRFDDAERA